MQEVAGLARPRLFGQQAAVLLRQACEELLQRRADDFLLQGGDNGPGITLGLVRRYARQFAHPLVERVQLEGLADRFSGQQRRLQVPGKLGREPVEQLNWVTVDLLSQRLQHRPASGAWAGPGGLALCPESLGGLIAGPEGLGGLIAGRRFSGGLIPGAERWRGLRGPG